MSRFVADSVRSNPAGVGVVLFDAVGTLIYPNPPSPQVYHAVGQHYGLSLSLDEIAQRLAAAFRKHDVAGATDEGIERNRWRCVVADVFDHGNDVNGQVFDELWNYFGRATAWAVYEEVELVWEKLEKCGLTLGIASNFDERLASLSRIISPLDRARHLFYSSQVGYAKPHREYFQRVQHQLGVEPRHILLVGDDAEKDFAGAVAAGWHALLIDRRSSPVVGGRLRSLNGLLDVLL